MGKQWNIWRLWNSFDLLMVLNHRRFRKNSSSITCWSHRNNFQPHCSNIPISPPKSNNGQNLACRYNKKNYFFKTTTRKISIDETGKGKCSEMFESESIFIAQEIGISNNNNIQWHCISCHDQHRTLKK